MAADQNVLRDWHRLFGLLLTDFFTDSPFIVEIERDLSEQRQFLDVIILRQGRGQMAVRLPDGLDDLAAHNLITFKSHRETLDAWAMKELIGHYVAYRKLVSKSPSELLPEDDFKLYAVCARFPHNLSGQVPWQERQTGVYDCRWGTDAVRIVVAGELPREVHNAPLHLFSASQELVGFGQSAYRQRSENLSLLLRQLFESSLGEDFAMSYTMADFKRDFFREHLAKLTPEERQDIFQRLPPRERRDAMMSLPLRERRETLQSLPPEDRREVLQSLPPEDRREVLQSLPLGARREILESLPLEERRQVLESLPLEERLAGLSAEQIREYLDRLTAGRSATARKPRRKK